MELIIGGAYQGKTDYARANLGVNEVFVCNHDSLDIDFSKGCVAHLERYVLACIKSGDNAIEKFKAMENEWHECMLISDDVSQGIVPIDAQMRAWREETGRLLNYLSGQAVHVHRVFLGIGQVLK